MSWLLSHHGGKNSRQCCPTLAAGGTCWKNNCPFSHNKEDAPICRRWQEGGCIGGRGNSCQLRHYYNETDRVVTQAKRFQDSEGGPVGGNVDYTSPYRVKVVKEVEKQRMEEVDLDTGKRRSWVETKEYDVYDLTGDTPAKPKPPLIDKTNDRNLITNLAKSNMMANTKDTIDTAPVSSTPISRKVVWSSATKNRGSNKENNGSEETNGNDNVDVKTCPMCQRLFKNAKGVKVHRSSKNSKCKAGKENLEKGTVSPIKAISKAVTQGSSQEQERPLLPRSDLNTSDSVIVIADTPLISRRRSTRLQMI